MSPESPASAGNGAAAYRRRATRNGVVLSSKMNKTVVVGVERRVAHPKYGRVVRRTSKFYAHDENNICHVGDLVTIVESRPLSRLKRWRVREIVRKSRSGREGIEDSATPAAKPRRSTRNAASGESSS